jgi:hypothetical protein
VSEDTLPSCVFVNTCVIFDTGKFRHTVSQKTHVLCDSGIPWTLHHVRL